MPRQTRLDIPGLVHHVIVRGIKRDKIFRDDGDRCNFMQRLHGLLSETDMLCYAWALIPNHLHLLLRPRRVALSSFMRRLLTGYAVTYNKRHNRSGHLFQNRYKSIICEEDVYLLELIRYIHLNPLRAHLVADIAALDNYPWCGHAEVLGNRSACGLDVDYVLTMFGSKTNAARLGYTQFIADGMDMGNRPELVGGGLRCSKVLSPSPDEITDFDDRILGSGEFVTGLRCQGILNDAPPSAVISLDRLQQIIEEHFQLEKDGILQRGRKNNLSRARCVFCYCAARQLQYPATKIAVYLNIGAPSVSRSIRQGERLVREDEILENWLSCRLKQ